MSEYSLDINQTGKTQAADQPWKLPSKKEETGKDNSTLTFDDMLMLMVTQMQNQTIDNQMDTSDMMNQLIQMTVMQALTDMTSQVEDLTNANIMSYSASLVGKEVTVGVLDSKGNLAEEIVGTVTATGTYNGQQVIFLGDRYYPLSSIMAVGKLPDEAVDGSNPDEPGEPEDPTDPVEPGEGDDKVDGGEGSGGGDTQIPPEEQTPEAATLGLRDNTTAAAQNTIPSGVYTPRPSAQSAAVQDSGAASQNRNTIPSGVYTPQSAASQSAAVQKNEATAQARNEEESGAAPWLFENGSPSAQSEEESGIPSWLLTQSEHAVAGGVPSWLVGPET